MFKRFSITAGSGVRAMMERKVGPCLGMDEAVRFIGAVLSMALNWRVDFSYPRAVDNTEGLKKYFDGWHNESRVLTSLMNRAFRVHFTIELLSPDHVKVKGEFFERGSRVWFGDITATFRLEDGMGGVVSHSGSVLD